MQLTLLLLRRYYIFFESDANVITRETVSESSILHDLQATAEIVQEKGDDDDDDSNPVEAALTPIEALTSMRELD